MAKEEDKKGTKQQEEELQKRKELEKIEQKEEKKKEKLIEENIMPDHMEQASKIVGAPAGRPAQSGDWRTV